MCTCHCTGTVTIMFVNNNIILKATVNFVPNLLYIPWFTDVVDMVQDSLSQ